MSGKKKQYNFYMSDNIKELLDRIRKQSPEIALYSDSMLVEFCILRVANRGTKPIL